MLAKDSQEIAQNVVDESEVSQDLTEFVVTTKRQEDRVYVRTNKPDLMLRLIENPQFEAENVLIEPPNEEFAYVAIDEYSTGDVTGVGGYIPRDYVLDLDSWVWEMTREAAGNVSSCSVNIDSTTS